MRSGSGGRIVVPLVVATALAGLILVFASASGGASSRTVPLAGTVDRSFGRGGLVTHSLKSGEGGVVATIGGIAVQADGKIVVAGGSWGPGSTHGWVLARYLPNGSPDPSFGDGGYVETEFAHNALAGPMALQPDGKVVVAGSSAVDDDNSVSEFTLARYNANGSLDSSFGTDGITRTAVPEPSRFSYVSSGASAIVVLPNGEILVAGTALASMTEAGPELSFFALARYKPGGSLDPTFGDRGIAQTRFDGNDMLSGIAVRPDGKVVATGTAMSPDGSSSRSALVQYRPDGSLDPTFGNDGEVAGSASPDGWAGAPMLQDGKVVVPDGPGLARYLANGRLDRTFGKHGYAKVPEGEASDPLVQKDGKILMAIGSGVARLLPDGRLDPKFGVKGIWVVYPAVPAAILGTLALQRDGKILAGGVLGDFPQTAWTLVRLIGGNNCVVPMLRGKTVSKATAALRRSFCRRGGIASRSSSKVPRGRVIAAKPARGARLPGGAKVALVVSRGRSIRG